MVSDSAGRPLIVTSSVTRTLVRRRDRELGKISARLVRGKGEETLFKRATDMREKSLLDLFVAD